MTSVGYYDISTGTSGGAAYAAPIVNIGQTAVALEALTAADLSGLDTLFLLNPSNDGYGAEFLASLDAINEFARNGGTVVIFDRYVTGAKGILPRTGDIAFVRNVSGNGSRDVNFVDDDGPYADGPGGLLDDRSLDGRNSSDHGYARADTLPPGAEIIQTTDDPTHVVTFSYGFGLGEFIYSTIPLDFYLVRDDGAMVDYAENVLAEAAVELSPGTGGADLIHVEGDGRIAAPDQTDLALASAAADYINAGGGNDEIYGGGGGDRLLGGSGRDTINGGGGNDQIHGGHGHDLLRGGGGSDRLWGDSGADTFFFRSVRDDAIEDFSSADGDRIDLHRIDADLTLDGRQAFAFIDDLAFSGVAGELRYADGLLQGDLDGDGLADFVVHLVGAPSLSAADIIV